MNDETKTEIVVAKKQGLAVLGSTDEMKEQLAEHSEKIGVAHEYVDEHFIEGIDFGKADPRCDKRTLLKPGAEKVCQLFNTHPTWRRDMDTWEMLGKPAGTICYICEIVSNTSGEIVGEGRGAEKVGNKSRDANKAIKIAEKCALVDAALYTFGLSERFSQDGAPNTNKIEEVKAALVADVDVERRGCSSSLTTNNFMHIICKDFLHDNKPQSVGAVDKLRQVLLVDKMYDLATGERIPE